MSSIKFTCFPRTDPPPRFVVRVIDAFREHENTIATLEAATKLKSDDVLDLIRPNLESIGFEVEKGKSRGDRLLRPVFFGEGGSPTKQYSIDAFCNQNACGLEVEAGRAVGGNAIYRDLIQAMVMVDLHHLCLAVPNVYRYGKTQTYDYKSTIKIADALYGHSRISMPYGLTVIGY